MRFRYSHWSWATAAAGALLLGGGPGNAGATDDARAWRSYKQISVRGDQVKAQAWRIQARKMQIDLWYSDDGEWLALQAPTESGRVLRYEIQ